MSSTTEDLTARLLAGMSDGEQLEIALSYIENQGDHLAWKSHLEHSAGPRWNLFNEDSDPRILADDELTGPDYGDADAAEEFTRALEAGNPRAMKAALAILKFRIEQSRGCVRLELSGLSDGTGWNDATQRDLLAQFLNDSILKDECIEYLQMLAQAEKTMSRPTVGDEVDVPEPVSKDEAWSHAFTGIVIRTWTEPETNVDMVSVQDQEDDVFDVEAERVERTG